eukprot:2600543-Pleurochrysis_carterae.AAC.2
MRGLVELGRVFASWRQWRQREWEIGAKLVVDCAAHAVPRDLRQPRFRWLRAGVLVHRLTLVGGGRGCESLCGGEMRVACDNLRRHGRVPRVVSPKAGSAYWRRQTYFAFTVVDASQPSGEAANDVDTRVGMRIARGMMLRQH